MKKILCVIILLMLLVPISVKADGTDKYYMDVYVNEDGSATFKVMVIFSGSYNYLERRFSMEGNSTSFTGDNSSDFYNSDIYNVSDITNICASDVDMKYTSDFSYVDNHGDCFTLVGSASNGQSGLYTVSGWDTKIIRIYNHSSKNKAFYLEYTVNDIVVVHNDVAEILFNLDWSELIDDVRIRVNLPGDSSELRVYSHGPVNGENEILNRSSIYAYWDFLNPDTLVDVRVVFDTSLVPNATKKTGVEALDKIIEFETKQAEIQNEIRNRNKVLYYGSFVVIGLWLVGLGYVLYWFYRKHDKEHKSSFDHKYLRELPATYGPEIMGYLFTKNNIKTEYLSASILELIRKKSLKLEAGAGSKKFVIIDNKEVSVELTSSEKLLKDWFINDVGNGEQVTNEDIKHASKKRYEKFLKNYNNWKNDVIGEGNRRDFYEENGTKKALAILYGVFGIGLFVLMVMLNIGNPFISIIIIAAVIEIIYVASSYQRTVNGNDDYVKWKAFKSFLLDFGRFSDKELPEIYLWDHFLVYATAFGIADKVEKAMNMKIKEMNINTDTYPNMPVFIGYHHYGLTSSLTNNINSSVSRAISAASAANSSHSSGSGFGGGASFGGGGGGFGGGGGGRG